MQNPTSGSVNEFVGLLLLIPNPWRSGVLAIAVMGIGVLGCADCAPPINWYWVYRSTHQYTGGQNPILNTPLGASRGLAKNSSRTLAAAALVLSRCSTARLQGGQMGEGGMRGSGGASGPREAIGPRLCLFDGMTGIVALTARNWGSLGYYAMYSLHFRFTVA